MIAYLQTRIWTLRYLKPEMIPLRIKRLLLTRAATTLVPIETLDRFVGKVRLTENALRLADLVRSAGELALQMNSVYALEHGEMRLHFRRNGDDATLDDISHIPWNNPGHIGSEDVNRANFISFLDQAVLAENLHPAAHLAYLAHATKLLEQYAKFIFPLPIPWQPLPAARRAVNLILSLALIANRDPELRRDPHFEAIWRHICRCMAIVNFLREDDLKYNHQTTEIFAQCVFCFATDRNRPLGWHSRELLRYLHEQVGADGYQYERSATYQAHLVGHLRVLVEGRLFAPDLIHALDSYKLRMTSALELMTHRDGDIALFNDSAIGDGPSPTAVGVRVRDPSQSTRVDRLQDSGFVRFEAGCFQGIFDVGACGPDEQPGHAHADFLSVELLIDGHRFFADPGTASYKAGSKRTWTRSAATHNGPYFEGLEPIEFYGAFRVARRGTGVELDLGAPTISSQLSIGGAQSGYRRFGGCVGRVVTAIYDKELVFTDVFLGCPGRMAVTKLLIPSDWEIYSRDSKRISFRHVGSGSRVYIEVCVGTLLRIESEAYYPVGPKRAFAATSLKLTATETGATDQAKAIAFRVIRSLDNSLSSLNTIEDGITRLEYLLRQRW